MAGLAVNLRHGLDQRRSRADELGRLQLVEPTVVDQLHVDAAVLRRLQEHLRLHLGREIPGRLAGRGCVDREDQAFPGRVRLKLSLGQELLDHAIGGRGQIAGHA
jgi:hypothetical protein